MKILLATNGLDTMSKSLRIVTKLMQNCEVAELVVLHVSNEKVPYYHNTKVGLSQSLSETELSTMYDIEKAVSSLFYQWKKRVEFRQVVGQPIDAICKIAEDESFDLIVVGRHLPEKSRMERISQGLIEKSNVPVLVAK